MRTLRNLILSYPRNNQPHNHEKSWFSNAAKAWELVKKSQMVSEYARHLGLYSTYIILPHAEFETHPQWSFTRILCAFKINFDIEYEKGETT